MAVRNGLQAWEEWLAAGEEWLAYGAETTLLCHDLLHGRHHGKGRLGILLR